MLRALQSACQYRRMWVISLGGASRLLLSYYGGERIGRLTTRAVTIARVELAFDQTRGVSLRILLIEDDPMIGKSLREALHDAGMSVDWTRDGEDGDAALSSNDYALVLLDLGLPGKTGLEILKSARGAGNATPLLVITAKDDVDSRIKGLDLGADDYLVKPFEMRELLARIRAVLRRYGGSSVSSIGNGEIELDLDSHEVRYRGKSAILPQREFALMRALLDRPGTILSRAQLENRIYGWGEEVESNAVDVVIYSLRRKFDKDIIRNMRGAGWLVPRTPL